MMRNKKVIVIGAGIMGLTSAYYLLKEGFEVEIYESQDQIGGMAAHFDFDGLDIEKFYHFICKPDKSLFLLLKELEISDKLRWTNTKMGYYYDGKLYKWGDPLSLISFPELDIISKLRYGLHAMYSTKRADFNKLDNLNALEWIKKWIGAKAYDVLWKKLFELKFFEYTNNLSAAWIAARIRRVGLSRKNIFQEELGYLDGGTNTLIKAIAKKINSMGGKIYTNSAVEKIKIENSEAIGIYRENQFIESDSIISTVPLPIVPTLLEDSSEISEKYKQIKNIPVVCVICKLTQKITENFWLNINDNEIGIPGIIEYTNLNHLDGNYIAYLPFYMPENHPDYQKNDDYFISKAKFYINKVNKQINESSFKSIRVFRYHYAQPICAPGYLKKLPTVNCLKNLYIADTSYYYPEDRSISGSIGLGKDIAEKAAGLMHG